MYHLLYASAAAQPFSKQDLVDLLKKAREKNQRLGITGMLLHKDGDFMQLLEGERQAVQNLFHVICADPRHRGTLVLLEQESPHRLFEDWSMGFRDFADPEVRSLPGFNKFMNHSFAAPAYQNDPTGALDLLAMFRTLR